MSAPQHIPMPADVGGLRIRDWMDLALTAIDGQSQGWRQRWLGLHQAELADLRRIRPDWAEKVEAAATADMPGEEAQCPTT